jgi:hypothetical protein
MVGRMGSDPSPLDDSSTVYLSSVSDPDGMVGTEGIGDRRVAVSSVLLRADCVRIVPRTDFKVSVGKAYMTMSADGRITIEGDVSLGKGAADRILRGDTFVRVAYAMHTPPTPVGPSGLPIQPVPDSVYSPSNRVR